MDYPIGRVIADSNGGPLVAFDSRATRLALCRTLPGYRDAVRLLALASSGGTVPVQALPSLLRFAANFEPLRQILDGVRAILSASALAAPRV